MNFFSNITGTAQTKVNFTHTPYDIGSGCILRSYNNPIEVREFI